MSKVIPFKKRDVNLKFTADIIFDGTTWYFNLENCSYMEEMQKLLDSIKGAYNSDSPFRVKALAPCHCEKHNP